MWMLAALMVLVAAQTWAQSGPHQGVGISVTTNTLWVSPTLGVQNLNVSDSVYMTSSTLPVCNASSAGQMRRSTNKACWCNGSSWQNIAPPSAFLSLLGVNILVADGCP